MSYQKELSKQIVDGLEHFESIFVVGWNDDRNDYVYEEIGNPEIWINGEGLNGYMSDSNVLFESKQQVIAYLLMEYENILIFNDESERTEHLENNGFEI